MRIAVGSATDIVTESVDIVMMNDNLRSVFTALEIKRIILKNVKKNLFFALLQHRVHLDSSRFAGAARIRRLVDQMPMILAPAMSCSSISIVTNALRLRIFRLKVLEGAPRTSP